ncbi:MAG: hypothetical protein RI894_2677 [Bacteroidota bacterium]|jgi:hypothetical protein
MTLTIHSRHTWLLQAISFLFRAFGQRTEMNELHEERLTRTQNAVNRHITGDRTGVIAIDNIDDLQKSMGL